MATEIIKKKLHENFQSISDRASKTPESNIVVIREAVRDEKKKGKKIIDMSSGDVEKSLMNIEVRGAGCAASWVEDNGYQYAKGTEKLRTHIQQHLSRKGISLDIEDIFITNGAMQALDVISFVLLNEGDEVIVPEPYWAPARNHIISHGGNPVYVSLNKYFDINLGKLVSAITPKTKAIYLNTPGNNPTGSIYNKKSLEELASISYEKGITLIYDQAYSDLVYDDVEIFNPASLDDYLENSIVVNTFSKSHSATGLRCGYSFTKNKKWMRAIVNRILHETSGVSSIVQNIFASVPLSGPIVEKAKNVYKDKRDIMYEGLSKVRGFEVVKPSAGFYVFPRYTGIPKDLTSQERSNYIFDLLRSLNPSIIGVHGISFGNSYIDYIRLAFSVCNKNQLNEVIEVMSDKLGLK